MKQNLFTVILLLLISHLVFGLNGQTTEQKISDLAKAVDDAVAKYHAAGSKGTTSAVSNSKMSTPLVSLPGNVNISTGLVTLPLDFLCNQPEPTILQVVACHVCSFDCTLVHNKFGGKCGRVSNPVPGTTQVDSSVCICNDSPHTDGVDILDLDTQCGPLVNPKIDASVDLAVARALRERMIALQCGGPPLKYPFNKPGFGNPLSNSNNAGCKSDCSTNHNYADGTCRHDPPVVRLLHEESNYGFFCFCTH